MVDADGTRHWTADLRRQQCGVLSAAAAIEWAGRPAVRWRLETGRWQRPWRGVVVTHSGPLTRQQVLWGVVLACGRNAVLAGLTAAGLDGLVGFEDSRIHVLVPASRQVRVRLSGVVVHRSRLLDRADIHPTRRPPRTRVARSLLDAAAWMGTNDQARAVLAAGVQQRIVRVEDLMTIIRLDAAGRRRWLDAYWDRARLVVEVDGMWHIEAAAWWADMRRDNDLTAAGVWGELARGSTA